MDRRTFLKSSGAAVAASGTTAIAGEAAAASNAATLEIKTALSSEFCNGYLRDRADRLGQRILELSGGRVRLQFSLNVRDPIETLQRGTAQAYFGAEADHIDHNPGLAYFSGLPAEYALTPEQFAIWLSAGGGQMHWDDLSADLGIKAFAAGHSGRCVGLWARSDISSLADIAGRSIRTRGLAGRVCEHIGLAANRNDASHDLFEPQMGVAAHLSETTQRDAEYWFRDGINQQGTVLSFGLSLDLWGQLRDTDKTIISAATSEAYHQCVSEHDAHDTAVAPSLLAARGVRTGTLPDDVTRAISHASRQAVRDIATASASVSRIHESYMQFRQSVTGLADPVGSIAAV